MPSTGPATLTFRFNPALKEALGAAANQAHRSIANVGAVLIRDYCGRNGNRIGEADAVDELTDRSHDRS